MIRNYGYTNLRALDQPQQCHPRHPMEDSERDVPQSLLFPHSLDTTAPGRQVLLRHQRVLFSPPTPPPSMSEGSDYGTIKGVGYGDEDETPRRRINPRVQRWKEEWAVLKHRVTPEIFPQAWLLFLVIIMIAVGTVITGWAGLVAETVRHQKPTMNPGASFSPATRQPAPPNLAARDFDVTWSHPQTSTAMEIGAVTAWVSEDAASTLLPASTAKQGFVVVASPPFDPNDGYALEPEVPHVAEDIVTTVFVTVTAYPTPYSSSSSSSSASYSPGSSSSSTSDTTSSTTSSSLPSSTSSTTLPSSTTSGTSTSSSTATPTTAATTTTTSKHLMYCPHSEQPDVWTLCPTPSAATAAAKSIPTAESAATRRMSSSFSDLRAALVSLWNSIPASGRVTALWHTHQGPVKAEACRCDKLERKLRAAVDLIRLQQRILDDQEALLEEHRRAFAAAVDVLAAMRNVTVLM
ncbi:hypothetical protein F5Y13DRAFT_184483 [Hypoxylon sp. FL1857]|nr:hypothetical protein F5Y13DRAFT_184483 [Hypoxylon sp. FL1857]